MYMVSFIAEFIRTYEEDLNSWKFVNETMKK